MLAYQMVFSAEVEVTRYIQSDRGAKWLQLGDAKERRGRQLSDFFKCLLCTWHSVRQKSGTAVSRSAVVPALNELRLLQDTH